MGLLQTSVGFRDNTPVHVLCFAHVILMSFWNSKPCFTHCQCYYSVNHTKWSINWAYFVNVTLCFCGCSACLLGKFLKRWSFHLFDVFPCIFISWTVFQHSVRSSVFVDSVVFNPRLCVSSVTPSSGLHQGTLNIDGVYHKTNGPHKNMELTAVLWPEIFSSCSHIFFFTKEVFFW